MRVAHATAGFCEKLSGSPEMFKMKKINKTSTVAYDVAEQLRTPSEIKAYLDAWLTDASDDLAGIARALSDIARARKMLQVKGSVR